MTRDSAEALENLELTADWFMPRVNTQQTWPFATARPKYFHNDKRQNTDL